VQLAQAIRPTRPTSRFRKGKDYVRFPAAQPTSSPPDQIEVAEAFMYSCPHCSVRARTSRRWVRSAGERDLRAPAGELQSDAPLHMRAYYAAQNLGVLDSIHEAFFDEIHLRKNPLSDVDSLTKFFVAHGVDEKALKDAMSSFAIDANGAQDRGVAAAPLPDHRAFRR
jgi:thiol:disulfide interchange protein DsbA